MTMNWFLRNAIVFNVVKPGVDAVTVPGAPVIGTAAAGNGFVDVAFSAPASNGGAVITGYVATLSTGEKTSGTSSPIRVAAANGTTRTANVCAVNTKGTGPASAESNRVATNTLGIVINV